MTREQKEFTKSVGHRLTVRMAEMSIDTRGVEALTGIHYNSIMSHRKGKTSMKICDLYAYAKALHCDINYFLPNNKMTFQ